MQEHPTSHFTRTLRDERLRRQWTQQVLADRLQTTRLTIGRWERGMTTPGPYFRLKLCTLFGKSAEELGFELAALTTQEEASSSEYEGTKSSLSSDLPLWILPYRRNPLFTGRETLLCHLHQMLQHEQAATLAQPYALSGLGGMGKTQTVIEYAYRYAHAYTAIFWVGADTYERLLAGFLSIADLLKIPEHQDQNKRVGEVIQWLNTHHGWLLILDNIEDISMVTAFLPTPRQSNLLFTTRIQALGALSSRVTIGPMSCEDGVYFLLRRTKLLAPMETLEQCAVDNVSCAKEIVEMMAGLPLALDQAGAYIEETGGSLSDYIDRYQSQHTRLLMRRGESSTDHPDSVSMTVTLSLEQIRRTSPAAADLLQLCAFLHPDAIPEELLIASCLQQELYPQPFLDRFSLDSVLVVLRKHSLLTRHPETKTLSIHRLVQVVLKDQMALDTQRHWAELAIHVLSTSFPDASEAANWSQCQRLLPHALVGVSLITTYAISSPQAGRILHQSGVYLRDHGHYVQAKELLSRAYKHFQQGPLPEPVHVIKILNDLAVIHNQQCQYTESASLLQQALQLEESTAGIEPLLIAETLNTLGVLSRLQGHYQQARAYYQRSLSICEQVVGSEHPYVAMNLNNLAVVHLKEENYQQAELLLRQVLHLYRQTGGENYPRLIHAQGNLALVYRAQGKYEQAEAALHQALEIGKQHIGSDHPDVATSFGHLAELYFIQGRWAEAEEPARRALAIREQKLGAEHPRTLQSLQHVAQWYAHYDRYEQALLLMERVLATREKALGSEHSLVKETREEYIALQQAMRAVKAPENSAHESKDK